MTKTQYLELQNSLLKFQLEGRETLEKLKLALEKIEQSDKDAIDIVAQARHELESTLKAGIAISKAQYGYE